MKNLMRGGKMTLQEQIQKKYTEMTGKERIAELMQATERILHESVRRFYEGEFHNEKDWIGAYMMIVAHPFRLAGIEIKDLLEKIREYVVFDSSEKNKYLSYFNIFLYNSIYHLYNSRVVK